MHQMLMPTMDTIKIANRDCNRFVCRDSCYVFHGVCRVILCKYPPLIFLWLIVPQLTVGAQSVVSNGSLSPGSHEDLFGLPYRTFGVPMRYGQEVSILIIDTSQFGWRGYGCSAGI